MMSVILLSTHDEVKAYDKNDFAIFCKELTVIKNHCKFQEGYIELAERVPTFIESIEEDKQEQMRQKLSEIIVQKLQNWSFSQQKKNMYLHIAFVSEIETSTLTKLMQKSTWENTDWSNKNNTNEFSQEKEALDDFIRNQMTEQGLPAIATIVFKNDNILYESYFGKANREENIDLAKDHLFLIGSISKTITATALLRLYDQGKFDLDDEINKYLPFEVNVPNQTTPITFRMLLTHTASLSDWEALYGNYTYGGDTDITLASFIESYFSENGSRYYEDENFLDAEPGTTFEYSNAGTALIGVLVEEISGISFTDYTQQHIFTPLNMKTTSWTLENITQTISQPYEKEGDEFVAVDHYTFPDYPNGWLRTTPRELSIFISTLTNKWSFNNYVLLEESTVDQMLQLQVPLIDETVGLHMFLTQEELGLWGHNGWEQWVSTEMVFDPISKVGIIIFTNTSDADLEGMYIKGFELGKKMNQ